MPEASVAGRKLHDNQPFGAYNLNNGDTARLLTTQINDRSPWNGCDVAWLLVIALAIFIFLVWSPPARPPIAPETTVLELDRPAPLNALSQLPVMSPSAPSVLVAFACESTPIILARSGEEETRAALQRIFNKPFVKVRPSFLINPETKRKLELDCYNVELQLGVEYSGIQHFVYPNPFHRSQAEFDAQQRRDRSKVELCRQAGVRLVVVPYTVPRAQIEQYLRDLFQMQKLNVA